MHGEFVAVGGLLCEGLGLLQRVGKFAALAAKPSKLVAKFVEVDLESGPSILASGDLGFSFGDLEAVIVEDLIGDDTVFAELGVGFMEHDVDLLLADKCTDREFGDGLLTNKHLVSEAFFVLFLDAYFGHERVDFWFELGDLGPDRGDVAVEGVDDLERTDVTVAELGEWIVLNLLKFDSCGKDSAALKCGEVKVRSRLEVF